MLVHKLPTYFKKEIFGVIGNTYPSLGELFDSYSNVLRVMELTNTKVSSTESHNYKGGSFSHRKSKSPVSSKKPATLENFSVITRRNKFRCSFCRVDTHSAYRCKKYASFKERLDRCKDLGLCALCTDPYHSEANCAGSKGLLNPCWDCKSRSHVGALCPGGVKPSLETNACYHDIGGSNLLLIMEVVVKYGGAEYRFNALIDSGSERSYLKESLLHVLTCGANTLPTREFVMKTFLGSARKRLREIELSLKLSNADGSIPFLVDSDMDLTFKIKELSNAVLNMRASGYKLAADFSGVHEDSVSVSGLLGVDVLNYLAPM